MSLIFGHPKYCCKHPKIPINWPPKDANEIANSEDPDQTAPLGAVQSGSALFAKNTLSKNLGSLRYTIIAV